MWRLKRVFLAFVFAAVALSSGCQRAAEASSLIRIGFEFAPRPPHVGSTTLSLRLADSGAQPVTGAQIALEGDMLHPGMAPTFGEAREIGSGLYEGRLDFKMAGDWVILAHVKLANGQMLERQLDLRGVQPN